MEEQKRQMDIKRTREADAKNFELNHFKNVGLRASDVYYVNEDKRIEREKALKGKSKDVAVKLREDYNCQASD
jgi:hypothetical protein